MGQTAMSGRLLLEEEEEQALSVAKRARRDRRAAPLSILVPA